MPRPNPHPPQQSMRIVAVVTVLLVAVTGGVWAAAPSREAASASGSASAGGVGAPGPADPAGVDLEEPDAAAAAAGTSAEVDPSAATTEPPGAVPAADVDAEDVLDLAGPAAAGGAPEPGVLRRQRLERALERWLAEHPDVGSVGVAVARSGDDAFAWTADLAVEADPNVDASEVFGILSVTKTFTEALVLREAAAGRIDLDAPMPALPDVAPLAEGEVITPRMLLQHSSGLVNYMDADGYDPAAPMTPAKAVSLSLESPRKAEPGSTASYSNSNFHWLGLLLEHVTGRGFGDLVAELAAVHGLASTALDPTGRPGWVGFASGGVHATLADVAHWGSRLFTDDVVLPSAVLDEYLRVGPLGVGLGVWPVCPCTAAPDGTLDYTAIGQMVAHGGLLHHPAEDAVVAVRFERVPGDVGTLTASLAGALVAALDADPVTIRYQLQ